MQAISPHIRNRNKAKKDFEAQKSMRKKKEMELKENNAVVIELYDVIGKKITDIAQNIYSAGKHQFEITNKNYEGVYFVRLSVGDNSSISAIKGLQLSMYFRARL